MHHGGTENTERLFPTSSQSEVLMSVSDYFDLQLQPIDLAGSLG